MSKAPEVIVKSDDPLQRVLHAIDRMEEMNEQKLTGLEKENQSLRETWEATRARLEVLEQKASLGLIRNEIPMDNPRKQLCSWLADGMFREFDPKYDGRFETPYARANEQTVTTAADGGRLVPDPLRPEVERIVEQHGVVRKLFTKIPMTAKTLDINTLNAVPAVGFDTAEAVDPGNVKATFNQGTLTAEKLIAVSEISFELDQDAAISVADFLLELFSQEIAKEEDREGLVGNTGVVGGDVFTGVLHASGLGSFTAAAGINTLAEITYENIVDTLASCSPYVQDQGIWVMSRTVLHTLRKLREGAGTGLPLWGPMALNEPATILGRPYQLTEVMPTAPAAATPVLLFGDFRRAFMGLRSGFQVDFSNDAGFRKATRVMRVMERVGFRTVVPTAFTKLILNAA